MLKKNEIIEIVCTDVSYDGFGKAYIEGQLILVKDLLLDEVAKVKILAIKPKVIFAMIHSITKASPYRVTPLCRVYSKCGGCQYQHIDYDFQCLMKQKRVRDCFEQFGHLKVDVLPVIKSLKQTKYRNKVQIPVQYENGLKMGFYRQRSNDIIEFNECIVQSDASNQLVATLKQLIVKYSYGPSLRHVLIKHTLINDEMMLVLVSRDSKLENSSSFIEEVTSLYPQIKSIILNHNQRTDNVILSDEEYLLDGQDYIQEKLMGCTVNVSSKAFYQINPYQTEQLYQLVLDYLVLSKDQVVVDLYSGTGTIGLMIAPFAKSVIGIEIVKEAVENAKENARLNGITNIEFICDDATLAIERIKNEGTQIDALVVDPPRKGLSPLGIEHILALAPKKLIYVSCDPATLARDIALLKSAYTIEIVQPLDMFPHTEHVECVCLLTRNR